MNVNFFKPFVDGTLNVMKIQANVVAKPGKPFYKGENPQPQFDLAAVIGLNSSAFNGSITICFQKAVYLQIMGGMLGETYTEITPELQEGAAELLNIIFGAAKAVLNDQGHSIQKAIPSVVTGNSLHTRHMTQQKVIVLPFTTDVGQIHIEIIAEGVSLV